MAGSASASRVCVFVNHNNAKQSNGVLVSQRSTMTLTTPSETNTSASHVQ